MLEKKIIPKQEGNASSVVSTKNGNEVPSKKKRPSFWVVSHIKLHFKRPRVWGSRCLGVEGEKMVINSFTQNFPILTQFLTVLGQFFSWFSPFGFLFIGRSAIGSLFRYYFLYCFQRPNSTPIQFHCYRNVLSEK